MLVGVLFYSAIHAAASPGGAPPDAVYRDLLQGYGIRASVPPTPATDFTLPDLSGKERALSDGKGKWILLTFFATWCGPCASEMPALERLHQTMRERGLEVLGVALDGNAASIGNFVRKHGATFPVLLDPDGRVGGIYQAQSIPLSYIIDPMGRIAGIARGARDWSQTKSLFEQLLELTPTDDAVQSAYGPPNQGPVELPSNLTPPAGKVLPIEETLRAGKHFNLQVEVQWAGNFEEYLLLPPEVALPEGVALLATRAETSSRQGQSTITYAFSLRAEKPGSYALDPVELRYTPRFEQKPMAARISGPTVTVHAATVWGLPALAWLAVLGGAAALAFGAWMVWRRLAEGSASTRAAVAGENLAALADELSVRFDDGRKKRMQGDIAGFLDVMTTIENAIPNGEDADAELPALVEKVRYGGLSPANEELDRLQRRIERALGVFAKAQQKDNKANIAFAETKTDDSDEKYRPRA